MKLYVEGLCIFLYFIGFLVSGIVEDEENRNSSIWMSARSCSWIRSSQEGQESFGGINVAVRFFYLSDSFCCDGIIRSCNIESCSSCIGEQYLGMYPSSFLPSIPYFTIVYLVHSIREEEYTFSELCLFVDSVDLSYEIFLCFFGLELAWDFLHFLIRTIEFFLHHSPSQLSWTEIERSFLIHAFR